MISRLFARWVDLDHPRDGIMSLSADFEFCPGVMSSVCLGSSSGPALPCVESDSRVGRCTDLGLSQACTIFSKCVKELCTRFTFQFDSQSFALLPWICVISAECRGRVAYCVISQN